MWRAGDAFGTVEGTERRRRVRKHPVLEGLVGRQVHPEEHSAVYRADDVGVVGTGPGELSGQVDLDVVRGDRFTGSNREDHLPSA
ncbi:MAG: hypothetical protein IPF82_22415 [Blastocatellia bacterium]|nr:hypothetical protein [Blastocatellia bacterium]